ncbi:MAG: phosphotransferase family protein [Pseudomonadota bacterium]
MGVTADANHRRLEDFLASAADAAAVTVLALTPLAGGAIQENWRLDVRLTGGPYEGERAWVLRATAPARLPDSHSRAEEFALLKAAKAAGVTVPAPLFLCRDAGVFGRDFFVMERLPGVAAGYRLVRETSLDGEGLLQQLGTELGRLHAIRPPREDLAFLGAPDPWPARATARRMGEALKALPGLHPVLEWALRWLDLEAPSPQALVLGHRDFRTGNYLVAEGALTGLLDWEFANWSDPMEDIGWLCAKCWRFGADAREAGGIGPREPFYRAYEEASGFRIDAAAVPYWEVMAHVRWAVIALQQCERHLSGELPSLELALTGRLAAEMELEILALIERREKGVA